MAGSKKPLEEKIVLKWEAQTDDAKKAFADIVSLAKASVKTIIQANTNYNKKIKAGTEAQIKSLASLEKAQDAYNSEFLNSSKHWMASQKKVLAMYKNLASAQSLLEAKVVSGDKRQTKQIEAMTAGLGKQVAAVESLVTHMNTEAAAFKKTGDQIEKYKKLLDEAAEAEAERMGGGKKDEYLENKKKSIDEIINKMTDELKMAGQLDDAQARTAAHVEVKRKAEDAYVTLQKQGVKSEAKKGIINAGEGLMQKAGVPGMKEGGIEELVGSLGSAGDKLKMFGGTAAKVGGALEGLAGIVTTVSGALFGFATLLVGAMIYLDNMKKEQNKRLYGDIGGAGAGSKGDMTAMSQRSVMYNQSQQTLGPLGSGMRTTQEEVDNVMNSMQKAGMTVKALGGNFNELVSATNTAVTASRNFGISVEEGGKLVGDYQDAWSVSAKTLRQNFATMTKDIKESGMATSRFLSIMQGLQSHFNEFLDQTLEFSHLLKEIGTSGAFSQKQMEKMANTIESLQAKGQDQALQRVALNSGAFRDQSKQKLAEVEANLKNNGDKMSGPEKTALLMQRMNLKNSMSGDMLNRSTGVEGGLSAADQVSAMAKGSGINSLSDVVKMMGDSRSQRVFAGKNGMSVDQVKPMLQAMFAVMAHNPQLGVDALTTGGGASKFNAEKEAADSASEMASQTVSGMGALTQTTNTILYTIANGIEALIQFVQKIANSVFFGGSGGNNTPYKNQTADQSKAQMDADNRGMIATAKAKMEGNFDSSFTDNDTMKTINDALGGKKYSVDPAQVAAAKLGNIAQYGALPNSSPSAATPASSGGASGSWDSSGANASTPTTVPGGGAAASQNSSSVASAGGNTFNVQAILQLKDGHALETVVKKVNATVARGQQQ